MVDLEPYNIDLKCPRYTNQLDKGKEERTGPALAHLSLDF
jgi:hypothetical protein